VITQPLRGTGHAPHPVTGVQQFGDQLYTNPEYRSLFGDLPLGVPIREAFGSLDSMDSFRLFDLVMETGEPVVATNVPGDRTLVRPDGMERFYSFSLSAITLHAGARGVLAMCLDVTDQVGAAQRIQAVADERSDILLRYKSLVQVSAQIVWVTSPEGDVIEPSGEWARVTGQSWEQYRGHGWLQALHPDDREPTTESWSRALAQVSEVWESVYRLRTVDDGYRHFRIRAVPIVKQGRVAEWVGMCTDIEDQWLEGRRRHLLDRVTEVMTSGASLEETLGAVAGVIVPELADGCGVHLVTDLSEGLIGEPRLVVERIAAVVGPNIPDMPRLSVQRLDYRGGFADAVQRGRPILRTFPPGSPPEDVAPSGKRTWLRTSRANSVAILPVLVNGTVTAVITAANCGRRPPIEQDGVELLLRAFEQAHDVLRNVVRLQQARQFAVAMQHSLLAEPPCVPGLQITARYRPSPSAAEVGGDWYDSFVLPDGATMLVIGDVADDDLRAATIMGQLRNMLRGLAVDRQEPPGEILTRLNILIETLYDEDTATCVLARVEHHAGGHVLHYSVAGHPPPLLLTEDGESRFLESSGNPLLGVAYPGAFLSASRPLPPRSTLLLYTDGLVEVPGEDLGDGLSRLRGHAAAHARAPLDELCDGLLSSMPVSGTDDIAMIALRVA
jgi:PAS domain S-box-containing protein